MKKWFLIILVCFLVLGSIPIGKAATTFYATWLHFSKYTTDHTLTAPYIIVRRDSWVWDGSTSTWTTSGSTYTNLDTRPVWDSNSNIWVWFLPQDATFGAGPTTLTLYDAADGAEAITDIAKWGAMVEVEKRPDGSFRFVRLPEAY